VASEDAAQLHGCLNELVGRITAACGDPTPGEPTRIANALLDGVAALLPLSSHSYGSTIRQMDPQSNPSAGRHNVPPLSRRHESERTATWASCSSRLTIQLSRLKRIA
jgi:hypothetical protein